MVKNTEQKRIVAALVKLASLEPQKINESEQQRIAVALEAIADEVGPISEMMDGLADDVNDWLDTHPEATTTVEDGAISYSKLNSSLKESVDDVAELKSALPTETSSGSAIVATKVLPMQAKELVVEFSPAQDLHGYDKPWAGGAGENKLIPAQSKTHNGVTFDVQSDGAVSVTGTASGGTARLDIGRDVTTLSAGDWFATAFSTTVAVTVFKVVNGTATLIRNGAGAFTLTEETSVFIRLSVSNGTTVNEIDYPGLFNTNVTPTWTPYANVCPITGYTGITVNVSPTSNPTDGTDYTVDFGSLIYGGLVNYITGDLLNSYAVIGAYGGEQINTPWLSSLDEYSEGATPSIGAQVVYLLSSPQSSSISSENVTMLEGKNYISSDGSMTITYYVQASPFISGRSVSVADYPLTNFEKGYIIDSAVGQEVNMTPDDRNGSAFVCLVKKCSAGDKFTITAQGGTGARAWAFTNEHKIVIERSGTGRFVDVTVTATTDGYFIFNSTYEVNYSVRYTGDIIADEMMDAIVANRDAISAIKNYLPFVPEEAPSSAPVVTSATYNGSTEMTLTEIYNGYDVLLSTYPDYVTKTSLGNDQSGTYQVYRYDFLPEIPLISQVVSPADGTKYTQADIPVIILEACLHGSEKPCARALLNLMDKICSSKAENNVFGWFRRNFHFVVIPVVNPWGYVNNTRWNSRHVDLNRNFPIYWERGTDDPTDMHYRGESAGSEAETQYVMSIVDEYAGTAILFYDYHTYGVRDIYRNQTDFEISFYKTNLFQQIGLSTIWDITKSGWNNHELPTTSGFIGFVQVYTGERVGMACNYGALKMIPSATPECMYRYNDGTSTETDYSPKINYMNIEYMMFSVFNALRKLIEYGW